MMLAGVLLVLSATMMAQVTSSGPVVLDYGKHISGADPAAVAIARQVRHELLMLPWYSLYDDLEYTVDGRTVILSGYLTSGHAVTRQQAEGVVKRIEGVEKVVNNIQVLPPSSLDSEVRQQAYDALMRSGPLSRYLWETSPSIHIVVKNQRITLTGFVDRQGDKTLATLAVSGIPGVFQVTNELSVTR